MVTHVAREGIIIGQFTNGDLERAIENGSIKETDHWWREGMKEWVKVSSKSPISLGEDASPPSQDYNEVWRIRPKHEPSKAGDTPATKKQKVLLSDYGLDDVKGLTEHDASRWIDLITDSKEAWRIRPKHKPSRFGDEPATVKQIALLLDYGLDDVKELTKYDASRWIGLITTSPHASSAQFKGWEERAKERQAVLRASGLGCDGHRTPSGKYRRQEFNDARISYWIYVVERAHAKSEAEIREIERLASFWDDILRGSRHDVESGLKEKLFSLAARLPKIPNKVTVKSLLKKLDAQSESWDDDQPDLLLCELLEVQTTA